MGKHGLSCDNVVSADLVNADGNHSPSARRRMKTCSGPFAAAAATSASSPRSSFASTSSPPSMAASFCIRARLAFDLLRQYRDLTANAPDEITAYAALLMGHGHPMAAIALCHSGSNADGAAACKQFYLAAPPAADMIGEKKYTEIQTMLDFTAPAGAHYYFKCPFLRELTDDALRDHPRAHRTDAHRANAGRP